MKKGAACPILGCANSASLATGEAFAAENSPLDSFPGAAQPRGYF